MHAGVSSGGWWRWRWFCNATQIIMKLYKHPSVLYKLYKFIHFENEFVQNALIYDYMNKYRGGGSVGYMIIIYKSSVCLLPDSIGMPAPLHMCERDR